MKSACFVVLDRKVVMAPETPAELIKYLLESDDDTIARITIFDFKRNHEFYRYTAYQVLDAWMTSKQENEGE